MAAGVAVRPETLGLCEGRRPQSAPLRAVARARDGFIGERRLCEEEAQQQVNKNLVHSSIYLVSSNSKAKNLNLP
jgi:hypothetical protein